MSASIGSNSVGISYIFDLNKVFYGGRVLRIIDNGVASNFQYNKGFVMKFDGIDESIYSTANTQYFDSYPAVPVGDL